MRLERSTRCKIQQHRISCERQVKSRSRIKEKYLYLWQLPQVIPVLLQNCWENIRVCVGRNTTDHLNEGQTISALTHLFYETNSEH